MAIRTLYHYCKSDNLLKILSSNTIWLSSLSLSNDSHEGRIVGKTIWAIAGNSGIGHQDNEKLGEKVALMETWLDGLGFCLSEEGDLLSQWRGYADDGQGVSIGFNYEYLQILAKSAYPDDEAVVSLFDVKYKPEEHRLMLEPEFKSWKETIDKGALKDISPGSLLIDQEQTEEWNRGIRAAQSELYSHIFNLFPHLFRLKSPAFAEEKEWRLVAQSKRANYKNCSFRCANNKFIPYYIIPFIDAEVPIFNEIILGPKNRTPLEVIQAILSQNGHPNTEVRNSVAPYI